MRLAVMLEGLFSDIRYAGRWLRRSPGFAIIAVFTLAIGVGANTAVFSILDQLVFRPLPYQTPDRLVRVFEEHAALGFFDFSVTPPALLSWKQRATIFEDLGFFVSTTRNIADQNSPDVLQGAAVSTNFLSVLGISPFLGRPFVSGDGVAGVQPVVMISHGLWTSRYASSRDVLGRTVRLDGVARMIVGVLPPAFQFPAPGGDVTGWEFLIPRVITPAEEGMRGNHFLRVVARLKPAITLEQANAEMTTIAEGLEREFPNSNQGWRVKVVGVRDAMLGEAPQTASLLLGAAGMVLLIGCVNVASLLLARATGRQQELSIRFAVGASRARIIRQLTVEYLLVATLGGLAGLFAAAWGKDLLLTLAPADVLIHLQPSMNTRVLGFASAITLAAAFLFGFIPVWRIWRGSTADQLKHGVRLVSPRHAGAAHFRMISVETALAAFLLFGAGVLTARFVRLMSVEPGFDARGVLTFRVPLTAVAYNDPVRRGRAFQEILDRVEQLPGVIAVGAGTNPPFIGGDQIFGIRPTGSERVISANYYSISPGYFSAMGIPLKQGRAFSMDDRSDAMPVAIITDTLAKSLFDDADPIGRRISGIEAPRVVVGVVGETKHYALDAPTRGQIYLPFTQNTQRQMTFLVRTNSPVEGLSSAIRGSISEIDAELPIADARFMQEVVAASTSRERFSTALAGVFAVMAVVLAGVGIYGMLAFFVSQRTSEVGLRMALGAKADDIVKLVVIRGLGPVILGLAGAVALSIATFRWMDRLVFEPRNSDFWLLLAVAAVILIVAFLSTYIPARRAAAIQPMTALRSE
jgi:putative ABC transport system permease protein